MKTFHIFLALLMLFTGKSLAAQPATLGTINTIVTKFADLQCAIGSPNYARDQYSDSNPCADAAIGSHQFDHPFAQSLAMFIGEFACLVVFKIIIVSARCRNLPPPMEMGKQNWNPFIFLAPAACDCVATTSMYVGLTMTYASSFQMLRGATVIFTGLLSMVVLKRRLTLEHWMGMLLVLLGLICVGLAAFLHSGGGASASNPLLGDVIIIAAQLVVALQMVVEEKFLGKHRVPALQAVGWEGVFGIIIMSFLCIIFYFVPGPRAGHFEDINDAVLQLGNSWRIALTICCLICSIAFFNFAGVSVTKEMNATTRMVLDSVRTLTIWGFSLAMGWENFQYLQVIGFVLLLSGTFVYNGVLIVPAMRHFGILRPLPKEKPLTGVNSE